MNKLVRKLIIGVAVFAVTLFSQSRQEWGLGITLGDPTGFSAKYNVNQLNAWNFNIGRSYFGEI